MVVDGFTLGLGLAVFAFSRSYALSIGMMVMIGMGQTGHIVMGSILLQTLSDKEHVGRVMSILMMCGAVASVGTFFVAFLTQFIGAQIAVGSLGVGLVLISGGCLIFLPWLKKID